MRSIRGLIELLHFSCVFVIATSCATKQPHEPALAPEFLRDGKVVLGSPRLTAGIPGEGPLSLDEIKPWIGEPMNHRPLEFVLPESIDEDRADALVPADNPLTRAKIELGRQLFFDKRLSGIGTFSCATCHQPEQFYTSYLIMPEVGRNASTVFNRILGREHFWDGRAESLEAQPLSPINNPFEMNSSPEKSTANIASIPGYRIQFDAVFGEVSFENICKALASFERVLVTGMSAWDSGEMLEPARRGEKLFFSDRLGCSNCHTGRNLTDEDYHNLGTSSLSSIDDQGRFQFTQNEADLGAFKTPSLRNAAQTPPYMHNGAFGTLEEVIEFFNQGGHENPNLSDLMEPLSLNATEKQDLVAFLNALTSELSPVETTRLPE